MHATLGKQIATANAALIDVHLFVAGANDGEALMRASQGFTAIEGKQGYLCNTRSWPAKWS